MTIMRKFTVPAAVGLLLFLANIPPEPSRHLLGIQLIADANAIFGVRRRTRRRSLAIGYAAGTAAADDDDNDDDKDKDDGASEDSASQQNATTKKTTTAPAPHPAKTGEVLALGMVVTVLPAACTKTSSGGIEYYYCAPNYYRAVFQGNNLVYVTAKP
jgi:hypothetical protein